MNLVTSLCRYFSLHISVIFFLLFPSCQSYSCCLDARGSSHHHLPYRNHSPDSLERNSHHNGHHHIHHHRRQQRLSPRHHASLHSLSQLHASSSGNVHGSTPVLPTYSYGGKVPPPPPAKPKHNGGFSTEIHGSPLISIPRSQLRRQVEPNDVTEL